MNSTQEYAKRKLFDAIVEAGLPIKGLSDDKPRWSRELAAEEQAIVQSLIEKYKNGGFDYIGERKKLYPPIERQLDMIYWDRINATTEWQDMITNIKNQYPK